MNHIIVTGASRGIGKTIAIELANAGYKVIATSRHAFESEHEDITTCQLDLTDENSIYSFCEFIKDLDIFCLINNAGGDPGKQNTFENWTYNYQLGVVGPMLLIKLLKEKISQSNNPIIFNVTSLAGYDYEPQVGDAYSVSKAASIFSTKMLKKKLNSNGIRFTEICPGSVATGPYEKQHAIDPLDIAKTIQWVISMPTKSNIDIIHISPVQKHTDFIDIK